MVFTANAGVIRDSEFIPARFHFPERAGEEPYFEAWFKTRGHDLTVIEGHQEGAGDALFCETPDGVRLFAGYGFRTDLTSHLRFAAALEVEVISLELVNPRFYHLDTCFCPLPGGRLIWHPPAFSEASQHMIEATIPTELRYQVSAEDARAFACNAVAIPGHIVSSHFGLELTNWLHSQGFEVHATPLSEFMKAGGGAKCLTLRIDTGLI